MMKEISIIAQLMKGRNPEEAALAMIKNSKIDDPDIANLVQFAKNGDLNSFNNLASNIFEQNGLNLEEELSALMSMLK